MCVDLTLLVLLGSVFGANLAIRIFTILIAIVIPVDARCQVVGLQRLGAALDAALMLALSSVLFDAVRCAL